MRRTATGTLSIPWPVQGILKNIKLLIYLFIFGENIQRLLAKMRLSIQCLVLLLCVYLVSAGRGRPKKCK